MEVEEAKTHGLELMETSKAAYLTTLDSDGFPITRAMFNLRNQEQFPEFTEFFQRQENEFVIFISTNTSSTKVAQIKNNPAINVYFCDTDDFKGFMLGGKAEILNDRKLKHEIWLDWWTRYYREGVDDPDYTIIRLFPKQGRFYHKLYRVNFKL